MARCAAAELRAGAPGGEGRELGRGHRRAGGRLPAARRASPRPGRQRRGAQAAERPALHPLRPAHAHRSLAGLRDARRGAAGDGQAERPRRDRDHRPQRDLGRARGPRAGRAGRRHQGDRRRGGEDRAPGRGDRPLHRGEDRAGDVAGRDDRRDQAAGRPGLRAPPVRPAALGARLRAPAGSGGARSTSSRSSTPGSRSTPSTRRPSASPASTASSRVPARTATSRRGWAASRSGCAISRGPRSSWSRCGPPTSSASTRTSSTCRR